MSDSYWWCPECKEEVDGSRVTNDEHHDFCGTNVVVCTVQSEYHPRLYQDLQSQLTASQERCKELEKENKHLVDALNCITPDFRTWKQRIAFLEGLLEEIQNHPHCNPEKTPDAEYSRMEAHWHSAGHRCCAKLAARKDEK